MVPDLLQGASGGTGLGEGDVFFFFFLMYFIYEQLERQGEIHSSTEDEA